MAVAVIGSRRRAFLIYLATQFSMLGVSTFQALLVMPQMLRTLGKAEYGAWLAFSEILAWLQFADLGLSNWLLQRTSVAAREDDALALQEQLQAVGIVVLLFSGMVALAFTLFRSMIFHRFGTTPTMEADMRGAAMAAIVASFVLSMSNPFVVLGRAIQRPEVMGIAHALGGVVALVITWLLARGGVGVWALAIGMLLRAGIVLVSMWILYRYVAEAFHFEGWSVRGSRFREIAHVAPAVSAGSIGYLLGNQAQISFVAVFVAPTVAARFAFSRKLFDLARSVFDAIAAAVLGYAADAFAENSSQLEARVRVMLVVTAFLFGVTATGIAAISGPIIAWWAGADMYIGDAAIAMLAAGTAMAGISYVANNVLRAAGGHREAGSLLLAEGVTRTTATYVGVTASSLVGVSASSVLSGLLMFGGTSRSLNVLRPSAGLPWRDQVLIISACIVLPAAWFIAMTLYR